MIEHGGCEANLNVNLRCRWGSWRDTAPCAGVLYWPQVVCSVFGKGSLASFPGFTPGREWVTGCQDKRTSPVSSC